MASRSWNRVELIGNLTRDPELRYTPSGVAVCTFGLATNRTYISEGEKREDVDFHRLVAWNKLGELCNQLLKKGSRVFLSGRLQYREWEPQEGGKRRDAEIVLEDMILLTPKGGGLGEEIGDVIDQPTSVVSDESASSKTKAKKADPPAAESEVVDSEDLPF